MRKLAGLIVWLSLISMGGAAAAGAAAPMAPYGLSSRDTWDGRVSLSWKRPSGAVQFKIGVWLYVNEDGGEYVVTGEGSGPRGGYWLQQYYTTTKTTLTITPPVRGRLYAWHVKARNSAGQWSLWSNEGLAHWLGTPVGSSENRPGMEFYWGPTLGMPTATTSAPPVVKYWESFLVTGTFGDTLIMLVGLQRLSTGEWVNPADTYTTMTYSADKRTGVWSYAMDPPANLVPGEWYQLWVFSWNPWQSGLILIPGSYVYADF